MMNSRVKILQILMNGGLTFYNNCLVNIRVNTAMDSRVEI